MAREKLEIWITLKDRVTKGIQAVGKSLGAVRSSVDRLKSSVFSLKGAFVAFGAGIIARDFLAVAMSFQTFETMLTTVTGSSIKAKESMKWITEFTAQTPYELTQVTNAFVKLVSYGFDPANKSLEVLGNTAAAMGKPLIMAVEMFADAATGEFERLKEFGIRAKQQGDTVTFSWVENGKQMVATAKKTQAGITTALIDIFEKKYSGAMDDLSKTVGGMWSNMKDQFTLFQKAVMDAGVFAHIAAGLSLILDKVNKLKEEGKLDEWAIEISNKIVSSLKFMVLGTVSVLKVFAPIMGNFKKMFSSIWDWFKGLEPWVQTSGLALAIMGGRNVKLTLLALAAMGKAVEAVQDEIKAATYEWSAGRSEIENYVMKLEILRIKKEKLSKASIFGETEEETEDRLRNLKDINAQIATIEKTIKRITPIKIFPKEQAEEEIGTLEKFEASVVKLFKDIEKRRKKLVEDLSRPAAAAPTARPEEPKAVPLDLATEVSKQLLSLEVLYQSGEEELIVYLKRRETLVLLALGAEMGKLEEAAKAERDVAKRLAIEDQLFIKRQEYALKEIEITKAIDEAREESFNRRTELEGMFADLKSRTNEDLTTIQTAELAEMDERHREELESFKTLLDDKLAVEMRYIDEAAALRDAAAQQQIEREKLLADQLKAARKKQLDDASFIANGMKDIANDLYEMSGKNSEKTFKITKALAIAAATVDGARAIVGVLGEKGNMYVKMAMAAIIAAKVGIQIAKIKSTEMGGSFAEGGLIPGSSPHSKADNVQINATAGEYMQPVPAVKYYGKKVMDGIKNLAFSREIFSGFSFPSFASAGSASRTHYAEGGAVTALKKTAERGMPKIEIVNVTNPDAIRGLAMDAIHENRDIVVNMVLQGLEDRNITLYKEF